MGETVYQFNLKMNNLKIEQKIKWESKYRE